MNGIINNEWTFSGECFYIKDLEGEFCKSIKIRGRSKRNNSYSEQIAEIGCLFQSDVWKQAEQKGLKQYDFVAIQGHIETWKRMSSGGERIKTMFIADSVISVDNK